MEHMKVDKEMGSDWYTLAVGEGLVKSKHRDIAETALCSKMEGKTLYMLVDIEVHRPRISVDVPYNLLMTNKYIFFVNIIHTIITKAFKFPTASLLKISLK